MHKAVKQYVIFFALVAFIATALTACSNAAGGGNTDAGKDPKAVAATVNGKAITTEEVEQLINQQAQGKQAQLSPLELAQARLQVLDNLIQREVLFQRAQTEKVLPSEEDITNFINDQKQQGGMTEEEFQKRLKEQNQTVESLREEARKNIAIQKLQDKYNGKISISDKEVEDFYNNNKQQFIQSRGVGLAMIVVDPADNSAQGIQNDAKGEAEAKVKIDGIYQQLKSNADFATVARARSEDAASLARGGDIGFASEEELKRNGFPPDLVAQFFNRMEVGSYTAPVQFGGRFYIFKLAEKRLQAENLTLNSPGVRQQITQALTNQRKQILNVALLEDAMSEMKIVNNLAKNMLSSPNNLSGPRPAQPSGAASPAGSPAGAASSPQANASASPKK